MNENVRKALLYFQPIETYWSLSDPQNHRYFSNTLIGNYPLSFKDRILQGHYPAFDEEGIPVFPFLKGGKLVHFYTGMCSYSFGNWELYLLTGEKKYAEMVLTVANFIVRTAVPIPGDAAVLYDFDDDSETTGITCAMNNGEAISVLCRAFAYTGNQSFIDLSKKLAKALEYPYGPNGLQGNLPDGGEVWFMEGGKYILNGHIYTLFGLFDLYHLSKEPWIKSLLDQGISSVKTALPRFNAGYWSYYWLDQPLYVASIMYHNLHICQLMALAQLTGQTVFNEYANLFRNQARYPTNRVKAGWNMVSAKIKRMVKR